MFKFFKGSVDELLAQTEVNANHTDEIFDMNRQLNYDEAVAYLIDEYKLSKEKAEEIANQIAVEQLEEICDGLVKKGLIQVKAYNPDGTKEYELTELGKIHFSGASENPS